MLKSFENDPSLENNSDISIEIFSIYDYYFNSWLEASII